jgi:tetratricopeptide (TPR) repeat protein
VPDPEQERQWTGLMHQLQGVHRLLFMYLRRATFEGVENNAIHLSVPDAETLADLEQGIKQYESSLKRYLPGSFGTEAFLVIRILGALEDSSASVPFQPAALTEAPSGGIEEPLDPSVGWHWAKQKYAQGKIEEGAILIERSLRSLESDSELPRKLAVLTDALTLEPSHTGWLRQLAETLEHLGKKDAAAEVRLKLAELFHLKGLDGDAKPEAEAAVRLGSLPALLVLGRLYLQEGKPELAYPQVHAYTQANPQDGSGWMLALQIARTRFDQDDLMRVALKACQTNLHEGTAFEALGDAFQAKAQHAKSAALWIQAAEAYQAQKMAEPAARCLLRVLGNDLSNAVARRLWERLPGVNPLPAHEPEPAIQAAPLTAEELAAQAQKDVYEATKRLDHAVALYRQAIKADPENADYKNRLNRLYRWLSEG